MCSNCQVGSINTHGFCEECGFNELQFIMEYEEWLDSMNEPAFIEEWEAWKEELKEVA